MWALVLNLSACLLGLSSVTAVAVSDAILSSALSAYVFACVRTTHIYMYMQLSTFIFVARTSNLLV